MPSPMYVSSPLSKPINQQYQSFNCSVLYAFIHSIPCPQDVLSKPALEVAALVFAFCGYFILKADFGAEARKDNPSVAAQ